VAEISVRKKIMKSVCQSNLTLESYRPESLAPLTEVYDQWEAFFDQRDNTQPDVAGSSEAPKFIELDTSD